MRENIEEIFYNLKTDEEYQKEIYSLVKTIDKLEKINKRKITLEECDRLHDAKVRLAEIEVILAFNMLCDGGAFND